MIVMKLAGGLGNQMFQYAFGRRLALENNVDLVLDPCNLQNYAAPREYSLGCFTISAKVTDHKFDENSISKLLNRLTAYKNGKPFGFIKKILPFLIFNHYKEDSLDFNPKYLNITKNSIFEGYWQNENYFMNIRNVLLKDFSLRGTLSAQNCYYESLIQKSQTVAIHIRRGDYLNATNQSIYHSCDFDYYSNAIRTINHQIINPTFFVFSDDIVWVKNNFHFIEKTTYIEGSSTSSRQDVEEMSLMMQCQHHIIANSSFSWWGAWLGKNPNKIVIAPKQWFNDDKMNKQLKTPDNWIRL